MTTSKRDYLQIARISAQLAYDEAMRDAGMRDYVNPYTLSDYNKNLERLMEPCS
jgi:hypothetical protein